MQHRKHPQRGGIHNENVPPHGHSFGSQHLAAADAVSSVLHRACNTESGEAGSHRKSTDSPHQDLPMCWLRVLVQEDNCSCSRTEISSLTSCTEIPYTSTFTLTTLVFLKSLPSSIDKILRLQIVCFRYQTSTDNSDFPLFRYGSHKCMCVGSADEYKGFLQLC